NGFGGVRIDNLFDISTAVTNGDGATIEISAPRSLLSIGSGALNADAAGTGPAADDFAGGRISLQALSIEITGVSPVMLSANASGNGAGGAISVRALGSPSEVHVGFLPHEFIISATGGSPGSISGDGGSVTLTAGRKLFVDADAVTVDPLGTNGAGASYALTVLHNGPCCGDLVFTGGLTANGVGSGAGGNIQISVNSQTPFSIGVADTKNGVTGIITANTDLDARGPANAGTISITNNGSGGIRLAGDAVIEAVAHLP